MLRSRVCSLRPTVAARSMLVITATSALLKIVGYFKGLFSRSVTDEHEPEIFTQIVRRGAHEIPYIFNKEEIQLADIPSVQRFLNHIGFQMAKGVSGNLFERELDISGREGQSPVRGRELLHAS